MRVHYAFTMLANTKHALHLDRHPPLDVAPGRAECTGRRVFVCKDFYASVPQQLSVFVDDRNLQVLDDSGSVWWTLRDCSTGQSGLVPSDIVEEAAERAARFNCQKNARLDSAVSPSPNAGAGKKKKKTAISFARSTPTAIPDLDLRVPRQPQQQQQQQLVEYDAKLEGELRQLLERSLDRRPGQSVRVYAGINMQHPNSTHKTIKVDEDMTVGEMVLTAGLKYSRGTGSREAFSMHMRHTTTFAVIRLDPSWKLGQVIELAKVASYASSANHLPPENANSRTERHYKRIAKKYRPEQGVDGLDRHADMDFATRFQFVIERRSG